MKIVRTNNFTRRFQKAPKDIKRRTEKALRLLISDLRHPSLRAKIIDETKRMWQIRVSGAWRLYFQIRKDNLILVTLKHHK